jgi:hypothetical protein
MANPTIELHHEGYIGEILKYECSYYRVLRHIRTDLHASVYSLEELDSGLKYELRVYTLRGISKSERAKRVKNLKWATSNPLFMFSFDTNEKKYCVFLPEEDEVEVKPVSSEPDIKTMNRNNTPEYNAHFPPLPSKSEETPKEYRRSQKRARHGKLEVQDHVLCH